jgi:hypothetical protein
MPGERRVGSRGLTVHGCLGVSCLGKGCGKEKSAKQAKVEK